MAQPLLSGEVNITDHEDPFGDLQAQNDNLRLEVHRLELELARTKRENARAIGALRQILSPLRGAIAAIFGEMDAIGGTDEVTPEPTKVNSRKGAVWEAWKQKLPGMSAKFIDALLVHGEMSSAQLRVVMQCRLQTVYEAASKLGKLGLLKKNGGKYSLKEL